MKNQELNPLELFFQSSSDACNLECSEQEELENRFAEWWEKQQKGYSDEEEREFFIEGYKQRAIASNLIFDNASRMYAINLFKQFKKKIR